MASPKPVAVPSEAPAAGRDDPSTIEVAGAAPAETQAATNVDASGTKSDGVSSAQDVPLPRPDQNESEQIAPQTGDSSENTELGAQALEEAQVTQDPLEAEVRCWCARSSRAFILTRLRITTTRTMILPLE